MVGLEWSPWWGRGGWFRTSGLKMVSFRKKIIVDLLVYAHSLIVMRVSPM